MCIAFGTSPSCGVYGHVANTGVKILHAKGIDPLDKWVDDHLFFQISKSQLHKQTTVAFRHHEHRPEAHTLANMVQWS